ncbi:MAG: hypothetical protein KF822_09480 [Steroidobacteraceae bacterium]|nr:hypothetical protein [Steroidobacteraceae bacterium]
MATNTLLTIDQITRRALMILHEKLTFVRSINRQYDPSFAQAGAKIGSQLRIRKPVQYLVTDGATMTPSDSVEQYTTLQVTSQKNVGIEFTSAEMTLSIDDYADRFLDPAMSALAAKVEAECIKLGTQATFNQVGSAGTVPATLSTYMEAREKLNQFLAPKDRNRNILIPSRFSTKIIDALKGLAQDEGEIARQYREGMMGRAAGFDWAESESMHTHTNGSQTMTGAVATTVSSDGATQLAVDTLGNTKTVTVGTVFTIAGVYAVHPETKETRAVLQQFVVTSAKTSDSGGLATLDVSPPMFYGSTGRKNISKAPADGDVITYVGTLSAGHEQGLAYHRDAFTFATADLELPQGGAKGSRAVYDGISLRVVKGFDITNDKHPARVDVLFGFAALRAEHACRITA